MVPIPILVAVSTPTVVTPETLNWVTDAIPPMTCVEVVAKPTLILVEALESKLNAVVAKDAVEAVPVKLPKKVTVVKPGFEDVITPVIPLRTIAVDPTPTVVTPETLNWVNDPMPPITLDAVWARPADDAVPTKLPKKVAIPVVEVIIPEEILTVPSVLIPVASTASEVTDAMPPITLVAVVETPDVVA